MTIERRRHPRFPLLVQITVHRNEEDFVMEMLDLSRGGARVDLGGAPRPPWVELRQPVAMHVPGARGSVSLTGRIVRIVESLAGRQFAVRFDALLAPRVLEAIAAAPAVPPPLPRRAPPRGRPPLPRSPGLAPQRSGPASGSSASSCPGRSIR